eukprot:tig00000857_g4936.t1
MGRLARAALFAWRPRRRRRYEPALRDRSGAVCSPLTARAQVEFAVDTKSHDPVVLKITSDEENHLREKSFLQTANTDFVYAMYDAFEMPQERNNPRFFCLVLEAGDEDLQHYFDRRHRRIGRSESAFIAHAVARALQYLHSQGLVHTDVKPNNVVRSFDGGWRLIDFEMLVHEGETTRGLTIGYLAPEAARAHPQGVAADKALDIWSLGGMLYELYTGRTFLGNLASSEAIMAFLRGGEEVALGPLVPDEARDLLTQMLSKDPAARPSIEQVLLHPMMQRAAARFAARERLTTTTTTTNEAPGPPSPSGPLSPPKGTPGLAALALQGTLSRTSTQMTEQSVEELLAERASLSARLSALSKDKARLIEEKQQSESKSSWIAQEAEVLRRKSQQLEESFMRLKKQQQELDEKLFRYQKENIGLKTMRGEMEREMARMEKENGALREENGRLRAELDALHAEIDSQRAAITHAMTALYDGSVRGGTGLRQAREALRAEDGYENTSTRGGTALRQAREALRAEDGYENTSTRGGTALRQAREALRGAEDGHENTSTRGGTALRQAREALRQEEGGHENTSTRGGTALRQAREALRAEEGYENTSVRGGTALRQAREALRGAEDGYENTSTRGGTALRQAREALRQEEGYEGSFRGGTALQKAREALRQEEAAAAAAAAAAAGAGGAGAGREAGEAPPPPRRVSSSLAAMLRAEGVSPLAAAVQKRERGQSQDSPSSLAPSPLAQAAAAAGQRRGSAHNSPSTFGASPLAQAAAQASGSYGSQTAGLARRLSPSSLGVSPLQAAIQAAKADASAERAERAERSIERGSSQLQQLRRTLSAQKGLLNIEVGGAPASQSVGPGGSPRLLGRGASYSALSALAEEETGSSRRGPGSSRKLGGSGGGDSPSSASREPVGGAGNSERGASRRYAF